MRNWVLFLRIFYNLLNIKSDFKKLFSLKLQKIKHLFGAACLWFGTYLLAMVITNIIMYYFPQNQEIVEGLNNALFIF